MFIPNVFIIESLQFTDEKDDRYEGKFLSHILHLGGKKSKYYYIRTLKELMEVLKIFKRSRYRYLHISCHGNDNYIYTTLDKLSFSNFSSIIKPYLKKKRLFISACSSTNDQLASMIMPLSGCFSIIGPSEDIAFNDAAIAWAAFYHLIFKENPRSTKRSIIKPALTNISNSFRIPFNYYSTDSGYPIGYKKIKISPTITTA
ncbi:MAG: hypothetical protein WAK60_07995 [Sedimentisphaerales bacterium]